MKLRSAALLAALALSRLPTVDRELSVTAS